MKYSRQRELIYKTVLQNPIHPSADTVYGMVRRKMPNISLGTVYRNLNLLSDQGTLLKISLPGAPDHFDGRVEQHCHMLCGQCGRVYDVDTLDLDEVAKQLCENAPFRVTGCHISFTGICGECENKYSPNVDGLSEESINHKEKGS